MKKNLKTLLKILVIIIVIVIICLLLISILKKPDSNEEFYDLRKTIEQDYNNYEKEVLNKGLKVEEHINESSVDQNNNNIFDKYFNNLKYDSDIIKRDDSTFFELHYYVVGDLLKDVIYTGERDNNAFAMDGVCETEDTELGKVCILGKDGKVVPSKKKVFCLKLLYNDEILIDDFNTSGDDDTTVIDETEDIGNHYICQLFR